MESTRRVQTRLSRRQAERLGSFAEANLVTQSAAVRILLTRALAEDPGRATEQIALASLVAAEHALLVVASILPEGDRRVRERAEEAVAAAERRLAKLTDRLRLEEAGTGD